jgi:hypothetical protein
MKSQAQRFLTDKMESGELTDGFYDAVGIPKMRIEGIVFGNIGATIKEIINVAKYFKVPLSAILEQDAPKLIETKECEHCKEWFVPTNARAIYCSDACRNKAFRGTGSKRKA